MKPTPTAEQLEILNAFPKHHVIKINAVAGSGKTSTLRMTAEANPLPSLYVCFNKQNAMEASEKFPSHVTCRTMHSLAYAAFGRQMQHKLSSAFTHGEAYVNKGRSNTEIAKLYGIPDLRTSEDTVVTCRATAGIVKLTVGRWQNSAFSEIQEHHVPSYKLKELAKSHPELDIDKYTNIVLNFAKKLWADRIDLNSPVQAEHDTYLKLWQLSSPKLDFDVIYVDEAQDTNPVCLDILRKQSAKMVYVGDTYQSIYAFRQAVNAMEEIEAPTLVLSKSFRYGAAIAELATMVIRGAITVKGFEQIESTVGYNKSSKYTEIFRTNSGLLGRAVTLISQGVKVSANIDTRKFENQLNSALALYEGRLKDIKDDEIGLYSSWNELLEVVEEQPELKRISVIVAEGQTYRYLSAIKLVKLNKDDYDVLLTTGHKSKGMEWENVVISDDFMPKFVLCDENDPLFNQQEVNLFYVACTRAIKNLQIPNDFIKAFEKYKHGIDSAFKKVTRKCTSLEIDNINMVFLGGGRLDSGNISPLSALFTPEEDWNHIDIPNH